MPQITTTFTLELEFEIEGDYAPAQPATPPSYASGGDPPCDEEIEVSAIRKIGFPKFNKAKNRWETTWLKLNDTKIVERFVLALMTEAFTSSEHFLDHACDAIGDAARD